MISDAHRKTALRYNILHSYTDAATVQYQRYLCSCPEVLHSAHALHTQTPAADRADLLLRSAVFCKCRILLVFGIANSTQTGWSVSAFMSIGALCQRISDASVTVLFCCRRNIISIYISINISFCRTDKRCLHIFGCDLLFAVRQVRCLNCHICEISTDRT